MKIMETASGVRAAWLTWTGAVLVSVGLIATAHYTTRDPDSRLYAGIAARLSQQPVDQWIAPEWWGLWGLQGPYCEHPVGIFLAPAALARLGFPAEQAAYAVNVVYQATSLVLVVLIARVLVDPAEARALGWLLQLLPIAFVFRIRANHEYALLAGLLLAVYSTERARTRPAWTLGMIAGFCAVLLVKGVFALMVPLTCAIWLIARVGQPGGTRFTWQAWAAVGLMPVVGALVAWEYETAYVSATGRSFLAVYQSRQIPSGALTSGQVWFRVPYTAVWYLARVFWYAFPWSVFAGWLAWRGLKSGAIWPWARRELHALGEVASTARQGAWFAIVSGLALTGGFSLAPRKADRYLFPVYFIVGAVGAIDAVRRFPWMQRLVSRLDRPWVPAVVYLVAFLVALATAGLLPALTFWRS
jgi:4-amino-4-deoxy-L-arabinose transferase-like glycosyltransferase